MDFGPTKIAPGLQFLCSRVTLVASANQLNRQCSLLWSIHVALVVICDFSSLPGFPLQDELQRNRYRSPQEPDGFLSLGLQARGLFCTSSETLQGSCLKQKRSPRRSRGLWSYVATESIGLQMFFPWFGDLDVTSRGILAMSHMAKLWLRPGLANCINPVNKEGGLRIRFVVSGVFATLVCLDICMNWRAPVNSCFFETQT